MLAKKTKADLTDKQLLRYNRHIVLPEIDIDGQTLLLNSKVVIIGLGGFRLSRRHLPCFFWTRKDVTHR